MYVAYLYSLPPFCGLFSDMFYVQTSSFSDRLTARSLARSKRTDLAPAPSAGLADGESVLEGPGPAPAAAVTEAETGRFGRRGRRDSGRGRPSDLQLTWDFSFFPEIHAPRHS